MSNPNDPQDPYGQQSGNQGDQPPYGQQPGGPGDQPPYGQQPGGPGDQPPYGQQPGGPGDQPQYNQPGAAPQYNQTPAQGAPYAGGPVAGAYNKTPAIILLVVSFLCGGNLISVILAVLALVKGDEDPATARKYVKWGWIVFAVLFVLLWGLIIILGVSGALEASSEMETYGLIG